MTALDTREITHCAVATDGHKAVNKRAGTRLERRMLETNVSLRRGRTWAKKWLPSVPSKPELGVGPNTRVCASSQSLQRAEIRLSGEVDDEGGREWMVGSKDGELCMAST